MTKTSSAWSFKGFNWRVLIYNNKDLIKAWLGLLLTLVLALQTDYTQWATALSVFGWSTVVLVIKHLMDVVDFWSSDVAVK